MEENILTKAKKIHFIGIGGIGISAIAQFALSSNKIVTGSDINPSIITRKLEKKGALIFFGHKKKNVSADTDIIVYTQATKENNPELKRAKEQKIPSFSYPQALSIISSSKFTVAVAGTHGKTTTTAMISSILIEAGKNPTVIVGSLANFPNKREKTNFVEGKNDILVVEACEYKKSFLNLSPNVLVVTNIDNDHLDCYKNIFGVVSAFKKFATKIHPKGFLVANSSLPHIKEIKRQTNAKFIDYGFLKGGIKLKVPGDYNQENAKAAITTASIFNIPKRKAISALSNFKGAWRRFEFVGKTKKGALVYDDYAHHPTEIKAMLKGVRELFPKRKIIALFQPHLYSRSKILLTEFGKSFYFANEVIVSPIYAAREPKNKTINHKIISDEIKKNNKNVKSFSSFEKIQEYLKKQTGKNEIIISIGAGDIYQVAKNIIS